jgi:hypothetical protein
MSDFPLPVIRLSLAGVLLVALVHLSHLEWSRGFTARGADGQGNEEPERAGEGRGETLWAHPLVGKPFRAAFERVSSRGVIHFHRPSQEVKLEDLFQWGAPQENLIQTELILSSGGTLVSDLMEIRDDQVIIGSPHDAFFPTTIWLSGPLPRSMVRAVLFRPPADDQQRDRLLEQLRAPQTSDIAWLDNGDRLRGTFLGPREANELADNSHAWQWQVGASSMEIDRSRVLAMAWKSEPPDGSAAPPPELTIGFRDGSLLPVASIRRDDRQSGLPPRIVLEWGEDVQVTMDEVTFSRQVCFLQPKQTRVIYLSDLEPLGFRHVPTFTVTWPLGEDRNVLGGRLRYGDSWAEKGLGMHSVSRVAYELPPEVERFQAELVLDRSAGREGSIRGRVYTQSGDSAWSLVAESEILRGGDAPWHVDVELGSAERLALIVDAADFGSRRDRANWLNARLLARP